MEGIRWRGAYRSLVSDEAPSTAGPRGATQREQAEVEFSRIVAFSDGVFAIAITLLVLGLEVPPGTTDLGEALRDRGDELFAYAISFAVLGRLWIAHHRFFSSLARFDGALMALNLLYLAWIALVPFTSEILGDYGDQSVAVIAFAVNITGVSLTFALQIHYSYRRGLVRPAARELERRYTGPANFLFTAVFASSIPVALLSPLAATLMWLALFFVGRRGADIVARMRASG
jgi:uncharacterized membrane protein